jgi:hypothetical protein
MREHLRLHYCNFFNPCYNLNCSAWERAPWHIVSEKSHLFHSKRRSGRDRESNLGNLRGKQRHKKRSAIHYALALPFKTTKNFLDQIASSEILIVYFENMSPKNILIIQISDHSIISSDYWHLKLVIWLTISIICRVSTKSLSVFERLYIWNAFVYKND